MITASTKYVQIALTWDAERWHYGSYGAWRAALYWPGCRGVYIEWAKTFEEAVSKLLNSYGDLVLKVTRPELRMP